MSTIPTAQPEPTPDPHRWFILIGLVTAAVMEILDTTIINVALPQMAGNLGATYDEIGWVSTGYILSNVVILPMTAWLASHYGRKNYLVASILIFIVSSFLCGTSRTLIELVGWRIAQGIGGAALISTAQGTLVEIFPRRQQGVVQAIFSLGIVVAPTLGPALGGWITDNYSWPWVFFVNVPVGLVSVFIVSTFLKDSAHRRDTSSIDWLGIGLLTVGLASLQYVLEEGKRYDWWDSVAITRLAITAGICLTVFIFWELSPRNRLPVVDLHVLKDRGLSAAVVIGMALGFGLYGGIFIFPLFTQSVLGFSPTETGLVLLPGGLATAVMVIFCGRVLQRGFDPRILIVAGMLVYMVSMWMLGHLTPQSGIPDTQLGLIVRGLGLGLLFVPIAVTAFAGLKGAQIQQGSALYNLARQIGGSIGIAVLNTYVTDMEAYHRADLVSRITSASTSVSARIASTQQAIVNHGLSPQTAHAMAFRVLDHTIQMQAATMSYNDGFLLLGITFIFAFPAVALLRRPRIGVRAAGAH